MLIKRIELTNWGPHKHMQVDLNCNVAGIIGPNGRGKSNFLQAIDFGLNKNLNKQNKEKYIHNYGLDGGAKSASVEIWFVKNGKEGHINRTITKTGIKNLLDWDGQSYTSDVKVSEMMTAILGADKAAMANAVFVKQGDLANLVKGTPAVRQEIFQKLMNMSFIDARETDIQNKINKLKTGLVDLQPTLDSLTLRRDELEERLTTAEEEIKDFQSFQEEITLLDEMYSLVLSLQAYSRTLDNNKAVAHLSDVRVKDLIRESGYDSLDTIQKLVADTRQELDRLTSQSARLSLLRATYANLANIAQTISVQEKIIEECDEELNKLSSMDMCKEERLSWELFKANKTARAKIQTDIDAQDERIKAATEAYTKVANAIRDNMASNNALLEQKRKELEAKQEEFTKVKFKVTLFATPGVNAPECPICGTPRTPLTQEEIMQLHADSSRLSAEVSDLQNEINRLSTWITRTNTEAVSLMNQLMAEQDKLPVLQQQLAAFPAPVQDFSDEQVESYIASWQKQIDSHEMFGTKRDAAYDRIRELQADEKRLKESLQPGDPKEISDEDLQSAVSKAEDAKARYAKLVAAENEINAAVTVAATNNSQVEAAEKAYNDVAEKINNHPNYDKFVALMADTESNDSFDPAAIHAEKDAYIEKSSEFRALDAKIKQCKEDLSSTEAQIEDVKARINKDADRRDVIDDLTRAKQLICKNGIPLAYMNTIFKQISHLVRDLLAKMQANFTVVPDNDRPLTFKFVRVDDASGYEMDQEQLSGGQAIRLSLAMLIACQQVILPDVGLLVLDEPSSHVDMDGVESLKEMFLQITSIFRNSETQLLVVDHNTILNAAFEKTVIL